MTNKFADVIWYDQNTKQLVGESYANFSKLKENLSFSTVMFQPLNAGHPSLLSHSIRFLVNSIFCALVIYLSFFSKHLRSDFRYFFGNLAICDFLYALSIYLYEFLSRATNVLDNIFTHTLFQLLPSAFADSMLLALMLTSFHRYMLIYKNNGQFFTKKLIVCMFVLIQAPILWVLSGVAMRRFVRPLAVNK